MKKLPNYFKITFKNKNERLRKIKNDEFKLSTSKDNTFHSLVCSIFSELPKNIRSEMKCRIFSKLIKQYLLEFALTRNTNSVQCLSHFSIRCALLNFVSTLIQHLFSFEISIFDSSDLLTLIILIRKYLLIREFTSNFKPNTILTLVFLH